MGGGGLFKNKNTLEEKLPTRMKKIQSKNFPDAQGQVTPQYVIRSGRTSNSPDTLWQSSLPGRMKIRSKTKAIE